MRMQAEKRWGLHFLDRLHEGILQVGGHEDVLGAHANLHAYNHK